MVHDPADPQASPTYSIEAPLPEPTPGDLDEGSHEVPDPRARRRRRRGGAGGGRGAGGVADVPAADVPAADVPPADQAADDAADAEWFAVVAATAGGSAPARARARTSS